MRVVHGARERERERESMRARAHLPALRRILRGGGAAIDKRVRSTSRVCREACGTPARGVPASGALRITRRCPPTGHHGRSLRGPDERSDARRAPSRPLRTRGDGTCHGFPTEKDEGDIFPEETYGASTDERFHASRKSVAVEHEDGEQKRGQRLRRHRAHDACKTRNSAALGIFDALRCRNWGVQVPPE